VSRRNTAKTQAPPTSWRRILLVNLALLATGILLVWGCGEVYYRFFFEGTDSFGLTRPCRL